MGCGCTKKNGNTGKKITTQVRPSRPLSQSGRIKRAEKRIIR